MSVIQVGLVDKSGKLDPQLVEATAAALNIQAIRDLGPIWNVQATVRYLPNANSIPVGVWPVFLVAKLPPGEGGVHLDKHNQPYSLVIGTPHNADWTIDASHETVEMLVDPQGNRLQTSRAIEIAGNGVQDATGQFQYLVEACDPCEGNQFAYTIDGIQVSDFITPHFYDPVVTAGAEYSFAGHIKRPRQVLPAGYISFINSQKDEWQQILWLEKTPQLNNLGPATGASLRRWVDSKTYPHVHKARQRNVQLSEWSKEQFEAVREGARRKSESYKLPPEAAAGAA
jgi:hypothetical protein